MSILLVVAVRDTKGNSFGACGLVANAAVALRSFTRDINGGDKMCTAYPADHDLYELGTYDTETGVLVGKMPTLIVSGLSVVAAKQEA